MRPRRFALLKEKYSRKVREEFRSPRYDHTPRDVIQLRIERTEFNYLWELDKLDYESLMHFGNSEPNFVLLKRAYEEAWKSTRQLIIEYDRSYQNSRTRVFKFLADLPACMDEYVEKSRVKWNRYYVSLQQELDVNLTSETIGELENDLQAAEYQFRGQVLRKLRRIQGQINTFISSHYNEE